MLYSIFLRRKPGILALEGICLRVPGWCELTTAGKESFAQQLEIK